MQSYWLKFKDGTAACCDGESPLDAVMIAEHITGKEVATTGESKHMYDVSVKEVLPLPYPASPRVWSYQHPRFGVVPAFCHNPSTCAGHTACPRSISCTE